MSRVVHIDIRVAGFVHTLLIIDNTHLQVLLPHPGVGGDLGGGELPLQAELGGRLVPGGEGGVPGVRGQRGRVVEAGPVAVEAPGSSHPTPPGQVRSDGLVDQPDPLGILLHPGRDHLGDHGRGLPHGVVEEVAEEDGLVGPEVLRGDCTEGVVGDLEGRLRDVDEGQVPDVVVPGPLCQRLRRGKVQVAGVLTFVPCCVQFSPELVLGPGHPGLHGGCQEAELDAAQGGLGVP